MSAPVLTILAVSYESRTDLDRLLPTIPPGDHEVLVVDNHGADGVAAWLAAEHPAVRVVAAGENLGYAGGNNLGLGAARGEWVLVLNPDTELTDGALDALLAAAAPHPDAVITPKIIDAAGRVYACGLEMHYTGITSRRAAGDDPARHTGTFPVPLPSGTALLARRDVLARLGGFDTGFFMYLEDVDLAIRARDAGHEVLCAADAVVVHHSDPAITPFKLEWLERNRPALLRKVATPATYRRLRPALALTAMATWAFALLKGRRHLEARWRARRARRDDGAEESARQRFQASRRRGDETWLATAATALPFEQLVASAAVVRLLAALTTPLYRLLRPRL